MKTLPLHAGERVDHEAEDDAVAEALALGGIELGEGHPLVVGLPVAAEDVLGELGAGGQFLVGQLLGIGGRRDEGAVAAKHREARPRHRPRPVHLVEEVDGVGVEDAEIELAARRRRNAEIDRLVVVVVALPRRGVLAVVDEERLRIAFGGDGIAAAAIASPASRDATVAADRMR